MNFDFGLNQLNKMLNDSNERISNCLSEADLEFNYENSPYAEMADDIKSSYSQHLQEMNATLQEQLALSKSDSAEAKEQSKLSNRIAIASIIIALVSIIISILTPILL